MTDAAQLTIGPMIVRARERAGLSQSQLSRLADIGQSHISGLENQRKIVPAHLDRLIVALDLDRDEVYHAAGRVPPEITAALARDLPTVRRLRQELGLSLD